jgi:hypothetical protein
MVEAENKYHTVYPSWDGPSVVCYLFLSLHMCTNNFIPLIVNILYITAL